MIRGSKLKHVLTFTALRQQEKSEILSFIARWIYLGHQVIFWPPMKQTSWLNIPMARWNLLNAKEIILSAKWVGDSNGPFSKINIVGIQNTDSASLRDRPWWEEQMEMGLHYKTILMRAAISFPDSEMENFGWIAEQLWAEREKLA